MTEKEIFNYLNLNHEENIRNAANNLKGILRKTDLIYSDFFSKEYGNSIYIKPENLQTTGSFKVKAKTSRSNILLKDFKTPCRCFIHPFYPLFRPGICLFACDRKDAFRA